MMTAARTGIIPEGLKFWWDSHAAELVFSQNQRVRARMDAEATKTKCDRTKARIKVVSIAPAAV